MIDVAEALKTNDEVRLLGWSDGTATKGCINIKHGSLHVGWGINDNGGYILESTPVTAQGAGINFRVER